MLRHRRRSIRLKDFDYSQPGAYFVTICARGREHLFGEIWDEEMRLNGFKKVVEECWNDLPNHYPHAESDEFQVMPNHVHGVIVLVDDTVDVGAGLRPTPTTTQRRHPLTEIVRAFKSFSARRINEIRETPGFSMWQRNYWDHIIRNEKALNRIREYISTNSLRWNRDTENPNRSHEDELDRWLRSFRDYPRDQ